MQIHTSACVQSVGHIIEQKRILSLSSVDIDPAELADPVGGIVDTGIRVTMRFKAAGSFSNDAPLIVTETFNDDSEAMGYVLRIFDLLAQRKAVVLWRRSLSVAV
jgi:hypothetical protein